MKTKILNIILWVVIAFSLYYGIYRFVFNSKKDTNNKVTTRAHIFYYNWYGNPEHDGKYHHWNHDILPHWKDTIWNNAGNFKGGNDIGANFYPRLGLYSSNDTKIIEIHMKMMKRSGVGAFAISWWGKDSYEDKNIKRYLDLANEYGLKLIFHIEPFYTNAKEFKYQIDYIREKYANHPSIFLLNGKPLYYVYDSYKLSIEEWKKLLVEKGELSLRNTNSDGTFIGLWVEKDEHNFFLTSGFNGFYTYFASDGFVYGSTTSNWEELADFANRNDLIFIPCVGPGYIDTRIRPWNSSNTKKRNKGKYYENMFNSAIKINPDFIGITSFNEWHEGTQIEPAIEKSIYGYKYEDYEGLDTWFYIDKTKNLIKKFNANQKK